MPIFRHVFRGAEPEDFPAPPIARRLEPGDVVEYEADEPVAHARLELLDDSPTDLVWTAPAHGMCRVGRPAAAADSTASGDEAVPPAPRTRKAAAQTSASNPEE